MSSTRSMLAYVYRPSPRHDYAGTSDDGRCLIYRDRTNGEDASLCVETDSVSHWDALWQLKVAAKFPKQSFKAGVHDLLATEKRLGSTPASSYRELARLAKKNGLDPADELSGNELLSYFEVKISAEMDPAAMGTIGSGNTFKDGLIGTFILSVIASAIALLAHYLDEPAKREPIESGQNGNEIFFICKDGQDETLRKCSELSAMICAGGKICVNCDDEKFTCDRIYR